MNLKAGPHASPISAAAATGAIPERTRSAHPLLSGVRRVGRLPPFSTLLFHPYVRRSLQSLPGLHLIYGRGWDLIHPFDTHNHTDTSGYLGAEKLPASPFAGEGLHCYGGSQPSIVRAALEQLPPVDTYTFVDLGAGKGRPVLVAAEYPFRQAVGVELSSSLVEVARRNQAIIRRRHPGYAPIRFEAADVAVFSLPEGDLVLFLYNPFGQVLIRRMVAKIEAALGAGPCSVFVIYYNPVHGACFDACPLLTRYHAATVPYAAEETGFGPDDADPVVIWQGGSILPARAGADAIIRITHPDVRCELLGRAVSH